MFLYLWVEKVCVHHSALDVIQVSVVLQRPLQETGLLTQLGHVGSVVVGEHLIAQDGICNLQTSTFPRCFQRDSLRLETQREDGKLTCGAWTKFISSSRVCRGPSMGLLFFSASSKKDVHCWIRLYSMKTSTIWREENVSGDQHQQMNGKTCSLNPL